MDGGNQTVQKPSDLDEQIANRVDDTDDEDTSGLIKFMMVFGVVMIVLSLGMIGYLGYRMLNEDADDNSNDIVNPPIVYDDYEPDDDLLDHDLGGGDDSDSNDIDNDYSDNDDPVSSCHPNCALDDLYEALQDHQRKTDYDLKVTEGYACMDEIIISVHDGDMIATITNDGGSLCYTPSGLEVRKVSGNFYSKVPGSGWTKGLATNENDYPYFEPDKYFIDAAIVEEPYSTTVKSYIREFEGGYSQEFFYKDRLEVKKDTIDNMKYDYVVSRTDGIEECFTAPGTIGVGECVNSQWYFDENLILVAYSPAKSENFAQRVFLNYDSNSTIQKPL